jgi:hypothetical protein
LKPATEAAREKVAEPRKAGIPSEPIHCLTGDLARDILDHFGPGTEMHGYFRGFPAEEWEEEEHEFCPPPAPGLRPGDRPRGLGAETDDPDLRLAELQRIADEFDQRYSDQLEPKEASLRHDEPPRLESAPPPKPSSPAKPLERMT